ncbi:MAG: serine--tRNA ligase [Micavibrio sp.]|nr:MAG: serine--tRNA ligase [Micavibrio sp.]
MFDLKAIRENPADFDKGWARRGLEPQTPALLRMDEDLRQAQTLMQDAQNTRNGLSKEIGELKKKGEDASEMMEKVSALKNAIETAQEQVNTISSSLSQHLAALPNIMAGDVPDGADEGANVEVRKVGEVKVASGPDHVEIGEALGMLDFEAAAKMSGARFSLLSGGLARLERALAQFFLDTHTDEHGYTEVSPPLIVRDNAMFGTGQLPKFAEDLFRIPESSVELEAKVESSRWLIPTAEVPLTNIVAESIVEADYLPRRYTAFTPCFRSEAGSAGKDTRGMLRQHQFYKVEMVSIVAPEESEAEHERMTKCAETVLEKLGLPFRTVVLCSGDTGFGATKTYDLEVWLPGQEKYREVSSCSNCGDFQARRMNARYKNADGKNVFVHTLNGSGVAIGRALIAVMENYYDPADGGIHVPEVLKPYMGGVEKINKT